MEFKKPTFKFLRGDQFIASARQIKENKECNCGTPYPNVSFQAHLLLTPKVFEEIMKIGKVKGVWDDARCSVNGDFSKNGDYCFFVTMDVELYDILNNAIEEYYMAIYDYKVPKYEKYLSQYLTDDTNAFYPERYSILFSEIAKCSCEDIKKFKNIYIEYKHNIGCYEKKLGFFPIYSNQLMSEELYEKYLQSAERWAQSEGIGYTISEELFNLLPPTLSTTAICSASVKDWESFFDYCEVKGNVTLPTMRLVSEIESALFVEKCKGEKEES